MEGKTILIVEPDPDNGALLKSLLINEGYGFLKTPDGREVYFHRNSVLDGRFEDLTLGSEVRFVEEVGEKGPQASTVALVGTKRS